MFVSIQRRVAKLAGKAVRKGTGGNQWQGAQGEEQGMCDTVRQKRSGAELLPRDQVWLVSS